MRIYLSVPLTGVDQDKAQPDYEALAELFRARGHEVHVPKMSPEEGSPVEIYRRDADLIFDSDCLVAALIGPSLGVGAEVALALGTSIPVIGLAPKPVSAFIEGMLEARDYGLLVRDVSVALDKADELGAELELETA